MNVNDPQGAPTAAEAAARWHVALADETATEADWLTFEQWLSAAPEHQAAYAAIDYALVDAETALAQSEKAPEGNNVVSFTRRLASRPAIWATGFAAIAASALFFIAQMPEPVSQFAFTAPAASDERVTLPDGSIVHLNRNAAIRATFGHTRSVVLERGEASFSVVHDEAHPFEVAAGDVVIRDIGTVFNVTRNAASTVVTVREGVVEIAAPAAQAIRVTAGYQAQIRPGAAPTVSVYTGDAFAWQQGRLIYHDAPLIEVLEDLSRYGDAQIAIAEGAPPLRFTGVLIIDDQHEMLAQLEGFLPIRTVQQDDRIVVRSRP